jgi:small subunit ribosomal protein S13e
MGRMHSNGKGISRRSLPYRSSAPTWCKQNVSKVTEQICKLAKKGHTPSQIGVILRDFHGVPQVKSITGSKILRILKVQGLAAEIPEDLYCLIKKAVAVRKHLERFRQDKVQPECLLMCCAVGVVVIRRLVYVFFIQHEISMRRALAVF